MAAVNVQNRVSMDVQEYMEKLKKASMRGRLKEARTAAAASPKPPSPNKGPER